MGTLVQAPERASVEIGGLAAIDKPASGSGGLGAFLEGILPAINQELNEYDKESRARVMALGQNDKLNNVMNEVSILDRQNYAHGRNYQGVVNGQIALAQKFQEKIYNADPATFDPEELLREGREFTNQSVNNIHDSALPADLKEGLYQAQLKENATYMKMVDAKIKQITSDNAATTRTNSVAEYSRNLSEKAYTPEELGLVTDAFIEKRKLAIRSMNPDATTQEVNDEINADLKSAFTFNLNQIKTNGNPEDLQKLQHLSAVAQQFVDRDLGLAVMVQEKADSIGSEIETNQVARRSFEVQNYLNERMVDPTLWTKEDALARATAIFSDGSIPYPERARLAGSILNDYAKYQEKLANAEEILDPRQESISSYVARGDSQADYDKDVLASFIKEESSNPAIGALKAIDFFSKQAEYSDTGVKAASKVLFNTLTGYARMSDSEVQNDPYSELRREQFAITAQMYNQFKSENMSKAYDLLGGLPSEYVDAFSAAFETGKSLEDVRKMFQNPVSTAETYANIERITSDAAGIKKALNLGKEVFSLEGSPDGRGRASISDGLEDRFSELVSIKLKGSKAHFAGNAPVSTATGAIAEYNNSGGLIKSTNGYASTIMDLGVAQQVQNWKVTGSTTPMGTQYFARSIDATRQKLAKEHKVSPSNVLVFSDATGQLMHFELYESTGLRGKGEPKLKFRGDVSMSRIKSQAETLYKADAKRNASQAGQDLRSANTTIGRATIAEHRSSRTHNVKVSADYAHAFGGNLELGTDWVNHMGRYEKYVSRRTDTRDANSKRPSKVYAMGITEATARDMDARTGSNWERRLIAAQGNAQETINIQGQFAKAYYKDLPSWTREVGIPAPNSKMYSPQYKPALMLLLDAKWHGGQGYTGMNRVLNAKSYKEARRIMQGLSIYNREKTGSDRNKWMEYSLEQYFRHK